MNGRDRISCSISANSASNVTRYTRAEILVSANGKTTVASTTFGTFWDIFEIFEAFFF
jgi:hypothetical protein